MQFQVEKKFTVYKKTVPFLFRLLFFSLIYYFFSKRLNRFINGLKINGFCRFLTESSVNFRKTFVPLTEFCPALLRGTKIQLCSHKVQIRAF